MSQITMKQHAKFACNDFVDTSFERAAIAAELEKASDAEIKAAMVQSIREFARRSRAVIAFFTEDVCAFQDVYPVEHLTEGCGWVIDQMDEVFLDGCKLSAPSQPCPPTHGLGNVFVFNGCTLNIPCVTHDLTKGLEFLAVLTPTRTSLTMPTALLNIASDIIVSGALMRLYRMKQKEWYSPSDSFTHRAIFRNGIASIRAVHNGRHKGHQGNVPIHKRFF